ncbi:MAG: hypothetical protein WBD22_00065 [Pyrinomonadaceae bacterium]
MVLPFELNLNSVVCLVIGLALTCFGAWKVTSRNLYFGGGLFLLGIGMLCLAVTNGFSDVSSRGQYIQRLGLFTFVTGLMGTAYYLYRGY